MRSGSEPTGLLWVEMNHPPERLEEFHDWYNNEHVPERLGVPGFVSARRYASLEAGPRWVASYELDRPAVLDSADYLHRLGPGESSWTRRVVAANRSSRRAVCELAWWVDGPGGQPGSTAEPAGAFVVWLPDGTNAGEPAGASDADGELASLGRADGVNGVRLYRELTEPCGRLLVCELSGVWVTQRDEFRRLWGAVVTGLVERSIEYRRGLYVRVL